MAMHSFEEFIMMMRRVSGVLGFGFIILWIIFLSINQLLNSASYKEDDYAAPVPVETTPIPKGCIKMGDDVLICDEPVELDGDLK